MKIPVLFAGLMGLATGRAAEWKDLSVVSDTILCLHVAEGHVIYPGAGERDGEPRVERSPLDLGQALRTDTWKIQSPDDADFGKGLAPSKTGRKSKGREYATMNRPYRNEWVMEHWIYLVLPKSMKEGRTYLLTPTGNMGADFPMRVVFNPGQTHSEAIHANEIGYSTASPKKIAYVSMWLGDLGGLNLDAEAAGGFSVIEAASGRKVFSGKATLRKAVTGPPDGGQPLDLNHWRADLWECDFSAFNIPGTYVLSLPRLGASYPFDIGPDVYREPFKAVMRGLYHNRCGTARTKPFTDYVRGLCHHPSIRPIFQSRIRRMDRQCDACKDVEATDEKRETAWGGYHDAGDWDREPGHPEVPMFLAFAYELAPAKFRDGELNIPESGNGLPDILDEALWGMDYYLRIQRPDGGVGYGLFLDSFPDNGEGPDTDTGNWYLYAEDPEASYKVAAAACHVSFALELAGRKDRISPYVEAAKKAWAWAEKNQRPGDAEKVRDLRNHAAAALFKATGDIFYQQAFVQSCLISSPDVMLWVWAERDQRWGAWTYVLTDRSGMDQALKERLKASALNYVQKDYVETADKRGSRVGYQWWNPLQWGRGSVPDTLALAAAFKLSGNADFLRLQVSDCDSKLGANPLNMVWITGVGERHPEQVFHPDSWYSSPDGSGRVVTGIVPEGPFAYSGPAPKEGGPWDPKFVYGSAYPDPKDWPPLELYFEARTCYPMNEFTVIQQAQAAFSYGLLCADAR